MESSRSLLRSFKRNEWLVTIDLKDAYLQISIHPVSRKYLGSCQGPSLGSSRSSVFSLDGASSFHQDLAPVSVFLLRLGVRIFRYLVVLPFLASSEEEALWTRDMVLSLCSELGFWVNLEKSSLIPQQSVTFLDLVIESSIFRASPTVKRIEILSFIVVEFMSSGRQPA